MENKTKTLGIKFLQCSTQLFMIYLLN